jgi:hypothetical protein
MPKSTDAKVNVTVLSKSATIFSVNVQHKLKPFLESTEVSDDLKKLSNTLNTIETLLKEPDKQDPSEILAKFKKAETLFKSDSDFLGELGEWLPKQRKLHAEKSTKLSRVTAPKKFNPTHESDKKTIQSTLDATFVLIGSADKKLKELNTLGETTLKMLSELRTKVTGFSLNEKLERCQRDAQKLEERIREIAAATIGLNSSSPTKRGDLPKALTFVGPLREGFRKTMGSLDLVEDNLRKTVTPTVASAGATAGEAPVPLAVAIGTSVEEGESKGSARPL